MATQDQLLEISNHRRDTLHFEVKEPKKIEDKTRMVTKYKLSLGSQDDEPLGEKADIPPSRFVKMSIWQEFMKQKAIRGLLSQKHITVRNAPNGISMSKAWPCLEW